MTSLARHTRSSSAHKSKPRLEALETRALLSVLSHRHGANQRPHHVTHRQSVVPPQPISGLQQTLSGQPNFQRSFNLLARIEAETMAFAQPTPAPVGSASPFVTSNGAPYSPDEIKAAYGTDKLSYDGTGQKIAIVDAF